MADPRTGEREVRALREAMAELDLKTGVIVTRNEAEEIQVAGGTIEVTPAWRFLLNPPES